MSPDDIILKIMTWNYVQTFIPFFLLLMAVEWIWSARKKKDWYRTNDAISSISCGIFSQLTNIIFRSAAIFLYVYIYEKYGIYDFTAITWQAKILVVVGLFLACDICYYWFHRFAHEINFGWAGHVVHHQSEEFNLTTALRQSSTQWISSELFMLPIALLGIPIQWKLGIFGMNLIFQFFLHTRSIGKLHPWFEFVFNTPSHHRVHHGRNPKYIDRNYGGTLIIWDRMFGSFQVEVEEPVYGIVRPLSSFNPLTAQLYYYGVLIKDTIAAPLWKDKIKVWFKHPGWRPEGLTPNEPPPEIKRETAVKFDPSTHHTRLARLFFFIGLFATFPVLFLMGNYPVSVKVIPILFVLIMLSISGVFYNGIVMPFLANKSSDSEKDHGHLNQIYDQPKPTSLTGNDFDQINGRKSS